MMISEFLTRSLHVVKEKWTAIQYWSVFWSGELCVSSLWSSRERYLQGCQNPRPQSQTVQLGCIPQRPDRHVNRSEEGPPHWPSADSITAIHYVYKLQLRSEHFTHPFCSTFCFLLSLSLWKLGKVWPMWQTSVS